MALTDQIQSDLTTAMKARDTETVATLRMVVAAIKNARVESGRTADLSDEETLAILTREAKKRNEAATAYDEAGREELAAKERSELAILQRYLPEQLDDTELRAIVEEAATELGASTPSDMGKVMSAVMPKVRGRADGKRVQALVKEHLTP
jgi:uncharacterized protein